jgi:membrane-associated phospholipid phosphatase
MNEIDKAEYRQAINAFLIPSSLFIACLLGAAGIFLIRESYGLGWVFIAGSFSIIAWAFFAFITFQNKLRANGQMKDQFDRPAPNFEDTENVESIETTSQTELAKASEDAAPAAVSEQHPLKVG